MNWDAGGDLLTIGHIRGRDAFGRRGKAGPIDCGDGERWSFTPRGGRGAPKDIWEESNRRRPGRADLAQCLVGAICVMCGYSQSSVCAYILKRVQLKAEQ